MKTQDANFANRPPINAANILGYGSNGVIFMNGPHWRQLRRICSLELFSSKREKSFSLIRQEEINSMLKSISLLPENLTVNLSAKACEVSNNITVGAAFGGKCKHRAMFLENLSDVLELFAGFNLSDLFPSLSWLDVNTKRKLLRLRR
jgi:alpha-guaiene 2-oxidase